MRQRATQSYLISHYHRTSKQSTILSHVITINSSLDRKSHRRIGGPPSTCSALMIVINGELSWHTTCRRNRGQVPAFFFTSGTIRQVQPLVAPQCPRKTLSILSAGWIPNDSPFSSKCLPKRTAFCMIPGTCRRIDPRVLLPAQFCYVDGRMTDACYDVAIIGGGPAGSTAATLLARAGRRVILFERDKFPRFHIGESLLPFSMKAFTRLGLHKRFLHAGFMKKFGGEIFGACSETGTKFYFKDGYRSQTDHAYQVTRGDFDKVLLDHAAECGAEVCEQISVDRVQFSQDNVELAVKSNGSSQSIRAHYLIDASGRASVLGRHFKIKKTYDHLQKLSIFAHYDGVWRAEGIDGTQTALIRDIVRWFWLIPLSAERTSIGVVLD